MQKLFIIYLMPLQNIDKTTRNRNKRNLSKLVIFPTLVFDEVDYWRIAQQQEGVWTEAWCLLEAVPAVLQPVALSPPAPNRVGTNPQEPSWLTFWFPFSVGQMEVSFMGVAAPFGDCLPPLGLLGMGNLGTEMREAFQGAKLGPAADLTRSSV